MANEKTDLLHLFDVESYDWPEDTGPFLLETLRAGARSDGDLLKAVEMAGDSVVVNDDLARELLRYAGDAKRSPELRARAAIALGPALEDADTMEEDATISEPVFRDIQKTFQKLYMDAATPKEVRRRILEASIRAPEDWHKNAVRAAYASDDADWKLTAVFGMRFIQGFNKETLAELNSKDEEIQREAVLAAGAHELDEAWDHVVALVESKDTVKELLLAAIDAVGNIRPEEAREVLVDLTKSKDEEIADAAEEAISMAQIMATGGLDDDEDEEAEEDSDEDE